MIFNRTTVTAIFSTLLIVAVASRIPQVRALVFGA